MQFKRCFKSSKFLLREHLFICSRGSDLFLLGIFIFCNSSVYLDWTTSLSGLMLLTSAVASLDLFTNCIKFVEGFNNSELSILLLFQVCCHCSHYWYTWKVLVFFHRINWGNLTATLNTVSSIIGALKKFKINIIEVTAFNMNPILTKVALNC